MGSAINDTTFQSNVGIGLNPKPQTLPVMMARFRLVGEIHVIQLKVESA